MPKNNTTTPVTPKNLDQLWIEYAVNIYITDHYNIRELWGVLRNLPEQDWQELCKEISTKTPAPTYHLQLKDVLELRNKNYRTEIAAALIFIFAFYLATQNLIQAIISGTLSTAVIAVPFFLINRITTRYEEQSEHQRRANLIITHDRLFTPSSITTRNAKEQRAANAPAPI